MSKRFDVIETRESLLADNDSNAFLVRDFLRAKGVFLVNLMACPGAGKTTLLLRTIEKLKQQYRIGVIEADVDGDIDAETISETGVKTIQVHTGGSCHMNAEMTMKALKNLNVDDLDLVFLENIGNLVCPAEFDTGAAINMTILSVPEGDDKPAKYPLMYETCDILVVNKIDTLPIFDFDKGRMERYARKRNPEIDIFYISAKTGEGVSELADVLVRKVKEWNAK